MFKLTLREIRESKNITGAELARMVGINPSTLSRIERNIQLPSIKMAYNIAKALQVSIYDFIED